MSEKGSHTKGPDLGLPYHDSTPAPRREDERRHHTLRTEIAAFLGEFIGTFMFLSLAFSGTQIALNAAGSTQLTSSGNPVPDVGKLLYIAFAFGISLAINVAIFAEVSGGKFNPAVSLLASIVQPYTPLRVTHLTLDTDAWFHLELCLARADLTFVR